MVTVTGTGTAAEPVRVLHCSGRQVNDDILDLDGVAAEPGHLTVAPRANGPVLFEIIKNLDRSDICSFSIFARPRRCHGDSLDRFGLDLGSR